MTTTRCQYGGLPNPHPGLISGVSGEYPSQTYPIPWTYPFPRWTCPPPWHIYPPPRHTYPFTYLSPSPDIPIPHVPPRRDLVPEIPTPPVNRMTDRCLWKHYLPPTSFARGNNECYVIVSMDHGSPNTLGPVYNKDPAIVHRRLCIK